MNEIPQEASVEKFDTMIGLGDTVKDKISGFQGIVTSAIVYLHATSQMEVSATTLNDSGEAVSKWFPEGQLTFVSREG